MARRSFRTRMDKPDGGCGSVSRRLACRRLIGTRSLRSHTFARGGERLVAVSATVTVIDRSRGIVPRAFDRTDSGTIDPLAIAKLAQLQQAARGRDAHGILELALKGAFAGKR